jgi:hypothetical protein
MPEDYVVFMSIADQHNADGAEEERAFNHADNFVGDRTLRDS